MMQVSLSVKGIVIIVTPVTNRTYTSASPLEHSIAMAYRDILERGLREDLGFGDLTVDSVLPDQPRSGKYVAKSTGVLSGTHVLKIGYELLEPTVKVSFLKQDGDHVAPGDLIAEVTGPVRALLSGERVILNILQHLSGIATATARAVEAVGGKGPKICDTRKTLPGLRILQKYAVRCGGGTNHRMRLDDGVMIKDNHIVAAGGIRKAVEAARSRIGLMVKVEVECETREQIRDAVDAGADIIMLDNKTPEEAKELCKLIPSPIIVELSGGITEETAGDYRDCGAHYLSMGSITHSVKALDISFNLEGGSKA